MGDCKNVEPFKQQIETEKGKFENTMGKISEELDDAKKISQEISDKQKQLLEEQKNCRESDVKTAPVETPVAPVVETPSAGESDVKTPAVASAASKLANAGKFAKNWKTKTGLNQKREDSILLPNGQQGTYRRFFNPSPRTKEFEDMTAAELYGTKDANGLLSKSYSGPNKPGVYAVISPGLDIMEINSNNQWEMQTGDHKGQIHDGEKWMESAKSIALKREERKKTERGKLTRKRKGKRKTAKGHQRAATRRNQEKQKAALKRRRAREERLDSAKLVDTRVGGRKKTRRKKRISRSSKRKFSKRRKKRGRRKSNKRRGYGKKHTKRKN